MLGRGYPRAMHSKFWSVPLIKELSVVIEVIVGESARENCYAKNSLDLTISPQGEPGDEANSVT